MIITKRKDIKNIEGNYILTEVNSKKKVWLLNGKMARFTVFNSQYDLAYNKMTKKDIKTDEYFNAKEIELERYSIYNIVEEVQ